VHPSTWRRYFLDQCIELRLTRPPSSTRNPQLRPGRPRPPPLHLATDQLLVSVQEAARLLLDTNTAAPHWYTSLSPIRATRVRSPPQRPKRPPFLHLLTEETEEQFRYLNLKNSEFIGLLTKNPLCLLCKLQIEVLSSQTGPWPWFYTC
jgi:hypothetical protein